MTTPAILSALFLLAPPPPRTAPARTRPSQLYFEQTTSRTVDGQLEGTAHVRVWSAGKRLRMETGDGDVLILRFDQGRAYRLEAKARTARVFPTTALGDAWRLDVAEAGGGTEAAEEAVTPERLEQVKLIAGHRCRGYRLTVGRAEVEVYVAPDLPSGVEAFQAFLGSSGADQTLRSFLAALKRLPGLPLETRAVVRSGESVQETVARISVVSLGPLRSALFEPPAGYRLLEAESDP